MNVALYTLSLLGGVSAYITWIAVRLPLEVRPNWLGFWQKFYISKKGNFVFSM
jgi:hypothetical protein